MRLNTRRVAERYELLNFVEFDIVTRERAI
jgi:hypothetical protein